MSSLLEMIAPSRAHYRFGSQIGLGADLPQFSQDEIKNEPMLFSATVGFSLRNGGPITREFLKAVDCPAGAILDTRSHMLMPGWWPCIPGWHHDDVPRSREDGQPNYRDPAYRSLHALALINGDICPTRFAVGTAALEEVPVGSTVYEEWDGEVNRLIQERTLRVVGAPSNRVVYFDWQTFHEGSAATHSGWRWFGRASWNTTRPFKNEVRKQVQVYLPFPKSGW